MQGLARIVGTKKERETRAEEGLKKLLGRDASSAEAELHQATSQLQILKAKQRAKLGVEDEEEVPAENAEDTSVSDDVEEVKAAVDESEEKAAAAPKRHEKVGRSCEEHHQKSERPPAGKRNRSS